MSFIDCEKRDGNRLQSSVEATAACACEARVSRRNVMTYQKTRLVALMLSCWSAAILCQAAQAQTAQDMVGSWALVANVNIREDGTRVDVYGTNPKGIQIFESGGRFALVTTRPDLPRFASNNRMTGTAEENAAIVRGSNASLARTRNKIRF